MKTSTTTTPVINRTASGCTTEGGATTTEAAFQPTFRPDNAVPKAQRRWLTVAQIAQVYPAFTPPAIRSLIRRSRPHYDHRGEWVRGNGLAPHIRQLGGKNGKVIVDEFGFGFWLESEPEDTRVID
jgi:hypothetical protein